jgi:pimeloyl-ACP methyl ester carboxylesterase
MMHGTAMDTLLTLPKRVKARSSGGTFVDTSAGRLHYVDTGGDKPVLLTTPDAPCVIEHHQRLTEILARDFRVVIFEMPGSGRSFPRVTYGFTAVETANAIQQLMDELGIKQAALAFSCVNCMHALNFAKRFPKRVSHLALVQMPSVANFRARWPEDNIPTLLRAPFVGQLAGRLAAFRLSDKWFDLSLPRPSDHREPFKQLSRESLDSGGCFCLSSIAQGAVRTPDADMLGATAPTDMVYGNRDFSHRNSDFQTLTDTVPQAKVTEYRGCGHFPNLERPEDYAEHLRKFVLEDVSVA